MNKSILIGLAVLTVSASSASALTQRAQHNRAMKPITSATAVKPNPSARTTNAYAAMGAPSAVPPGASSKNHELYMKNLRDSGYDPKKDFTAAGTIREK